MPRKLTDALGRDIKKIRRFNEKTFYDFVTPDQIEIVKYKLDMAKVVYRTERVTRSGKIVGYKIWVY
jgi:hypothetical protein